MPPGREQAAAGQHLWEESWDDDDTNEDFSKQLKYEHTSPGIYLWLTLFSQGGARKGQESEIKRDPGHDSALMKASSVCHPSSTFLLEQYIPKIFYRDLQTRLVPFQPSIRFPSNSDLTYSTERSPQASPYPLIILSWHHHPSRHGSAYLLSHTSQPRLLYHHHQ